MQTIKTIVLSVFLLGILFINTACASFENAVVKGATTLTGGHFIATQYSGGVLIRQWEINGIVTEEMESDGWNFSCNGLVRLSGDLVVEPFDSVPERLIQTDRIICSSPTPKTKIEPIAPSDTEVSPLVNESLNMKS